MIYLKFLIDGNCDRVPEHAAIEAYKDIVGETDVRLKTEQMGWRFVACAGIPNLLGGVELIMAEYEARKHALAKGK